MSPVSDLLKRAVADLEQGWHEAAVDALGRAIRASEAERWEAMEQRLERVVAEMVGIVADVDSRLRALEERPGGLSPALVELNAFRSSDSRRLDREIKEILSAACPRWLTAKETWHALHAGGFHPLPSVRTLRAHLRAIRGKRHHAVMSQPGVFGASASVIIKPDLSGDVNV